MCQLSRDQFITSCVEFVSISADVGDVWEIVENESSNSVWIKKTTQITEANQSDLESEKISKDTQENTDLMGLIDDQCVESLPSHSQKQLTCSYEVHYSPSYAVPVLYCRFWNCSGELLSFEEVWNMVPLPARGWDRVSRCVCAGVEPSLFAAGGQWWHIPQGRCDSSRDRVWGQVRLFTDISRRRRLNHRTRWS